MGRYELPKDCGTHGKLRLGELSDCVTLAFLSVLLATVFLGAVTAIAFVYSWVMSLAGMVL